MPGSLLIPSTIDHGIHDEIEALLRERIPHRNEKYYEILLCARTQLIDEAYRVEIKADAIIKIVTPPGPPGMPILKV